MSIAKIHTAAFALVSAIFLASVFLGAAAGPAIIA
ncbi:hypothetical protein M529_13770 [Sphingobium ummariense RL-3]|uniref:Uncharacterized protein n=1 Tax=Sphingobium ummariense RL-3 TaxID=1346791 RepID=T0IRZ0_9SPHN|nr:hypothetical protein M529_13770 [Sphingobium ummariense RL-3]